MQITLVSASPISFVQPLYDPVQPVRPKISAQGVNAGLPFVSERANQARLETMNSKRTREAGNMPAAPVAASSRAIAASAAMPGPPREEAIDQILSANLDLGLEITTQTNGELFEYRIASPVSVPRNTSALLTIVQQTVGGERISLFNESRNHRFPYSAIKLKNTTGLTLEAGPVTVMEGNAYAGEALIDVVKADDTRLIAYAIDQAVHVIAEQDIVRLPVWQIRTVHGYLFFDYKELSKKTYQIDNLSDHSKVVYVEHPFLVDRKYVGDLKPAETTDKNYRFRLEVEAKKNRSFSVPEEHNSSIQIWLDSWDSLHIPQVDWALRQNYIDDKILRFLRELVNRRNEIFDLMQQERRFKEFLVECQQEQERARENVRILGANSERYKRAIDESEDKIQAATAELNRLGSEIALKRRDFTTFITEDLQSQLDAKAEEESAATV